MKNDLITNSPKFWVLFIAISIVGNIWMYLNIAYGKTAIQDLLVVQIPLMSAFVIGLVGLRYVSNKSNNLGYPRVLKTSFFKWYIPLLVISIFAICLVNLLWLFN